MTTRKPLSTRESREIEHGLWIAERDSEDIWGWGTPAGRVRAARRARLIAEGAQLTAGCHALEIGCGAGLFTEMFAATGARVVAIDVSDALLERARARQIQGRVEFVCGRFESLALDESFDAAIGSSVLHHLDLDEALAQIRRLVRPGGHIGFAEPNLCNPQVLLERHARPLFNYVSPDETAFMRGPLARQLGRHGFTDVRIVPFDWLHPSTPAWAIPAVRAVGRALERLPIVCELAGSLLITGRRP